MDKFLIFTIVGLSLASVYAVISSGLVLTYATTGLFNFAHGAIGMLAAFTYWQLRFDWGWSTPLALIVVVGVAAPLSGLILERVIMRGLVGTSEATRLVVSISLLVGLIGLANLIWSPGRSRPMRTFFQGRSLDLGVTSITYHEAITIITAIIVAVGLRWLLHGTRIGVSMRANVDDRSLTLLNGARPDRIAQFSWVIGCSLAAVGGILIAPSLSLESGSLSLLIVNAYAAAIFGRLRSLPLTFLGALLIGLTEGYLGAYLPGDNPYFAGLRPAAAVFILFLALIWVPNPRLRTRTEIREYFPRPSRSGVAIMAALTIIIAVGMVAILGDTSLIDYGQIFSLGIIALSLVPLVGYAGQISLAQLTFGGVGTVAAAHHGIGGSPVGLLAAVVMAAAVGAIVALPLMRLSGIYLALATAAFAVAMDRWIFNLPDFHIGSLRLSMFDLGSIRVEPLELFGYRFDTPGRQLMLSATVLSLLIVLVAALRMGRFGRQLVAMRDSEAACATFGLDLRWSRIGVFTLSAAIAGLGGALYGMQLGTVGAQRYELLAGLPIFILVVVGGAGLVGSSLFAGVALFGLIPLTSALGPVFAKINTVTPGLTGIGLGRHPSGAVAVMKNRFRPLRDDRLLFLLTLAAMAALFSLRLLGVIDNPALLVGTLIAVLVGGTAARRRQPGSLAEATDEDRAKPAGEAIEFAGVTRPWNASDLAQMDAVLTLDGARGPTPHPAPAADTAVVASGPGGDGGDHARS